MSGPELIWIVAPAIIVLAFAANLWNADLSADGDSVESSYDGEVRVGRRFGEGGRYAVLKTFAGGFISMDIRGSRVRIGTATGLGRLLAAAIGLSYRLDASRFEASREAVFPPPKSIRPRADGVVLRGTNHRGRYAEFTLVPRDSDVARLLIALERAGARSERSDAQSV